jgi:hypothetical protein
LFWFWSGRRGEAPAGCGAEPRPAALVLEKIALAELIGVEDVSADCSLEPPRLSAEVFDGKIYHLLVDKVTVRYILAHNRLQPVPFAR